MSERDKEIAELAKNILGNVIQGTLAGGRATIDPKEAAKAAVLCATALVDMLADERN